MERNRNIRKLDKNRKKRESRRDPYVNADTSTVRSRQTYRRRRINVVAILIGLVVLAVAIFGGIYAYNRILKNEETVIYTEVGEATLPQIAFVEEGYEVNTLLAYTQEMDILTMRDSISPLTPQGKLTAIIKPYDNEITELSYKVYSIDGTLLLKEETLTEWEDNEVTIDLNNVIPDVEESLLQVALTQEDGTTTYYYTRLITYGSCNLSSNLDFVSAFHEAILYQSSTEIEEEYETQSSMEEDDAAVLDQESLDISSYLTSSSSASNGTLQYVTQASSESDVKWGTLEPGVIGEVSWTITECSSLFVSVLLEYQVEAINQESGELETYNVEEFFRVSYSSTTSSVQLKQYVRTVNEVFDTYQLNVSSTGFDLGITASDIEYKMNEEGTAVAFVQERALYVYDSEDNSIVEVLTLEDNTLRTSDSRYGNSEYAIDILSIDEDASISFVVYGYMNRGDYEGQVGTGVYFYDGTTNTLVEKAFVSHTTSFAVGEDDMSQGMYYSNESNTLYLIAQNTFYKVELSEDTQTKLAEGIDESSYVISDDGKYIAYVSADVCTVLEFETGESISIKTTGAEQIAPFGFLDHDLIYGVYNLDDVLLDETGNEMIPMYKILICDEEGNTLKTYESENQYIRDVSIMDNMITLSLVEKEGESYVYTGIDVITNNASTAAGSVEVKSYNSDLKQLVQKLYFTVDIEDSYEVAKVIVPTMAYSEDKITISYDSEPVEEMYYAYAYGALQLQSTLASDAIKYASENTGAVVNEDLQYVWRSGSRDLTFTVSKYSTYASRLSGGESAIGIISEAASQNVVFYTGCTTEQMCYIINQEKVIAAKLDDDSWVLLVGYSGSTMYYLDGNGTKTSINMSTLDSQVVELVGDGLF